MKRIIHKHPLAIRWFHWINFPILSVMIWSGLLIYWAYGTYKIQIGDVVLVKFFSKEFYKFLGVPQNLAKGMAWHFMVMWLFTINGVLYVSYTLFSGEWRLLLPNRNSFREAWEVTLHDLGIRKTAPLQTKYNGAQRIAYSSIIFMGLGSLLTGLAIYRPIQLAWLTYLLGGYEMTRLEHFALTLGYVLFFVIHIAQVIRAGWRNFQSIITGFEVADETLNSLTNERGTHEQTADSPTDN